MKTNIATVNFVCIPDEQGEICPLAEIYLKGGGSDDELVKSTCHSKICIENGIAMYSASFGGLAKLSNNSNQKSGKELVVETLESQECKDILAGRTQSKESDTANQKNDENKTDKIQTEKSDTTNQKSDATNQKSEENKTDKSISDDHGNNGKKTRYYNTNCILLIGE